MSARVEVVVSDPWEFETQVGTGQLAGVIQDVCAEPGEGIVVVFERPVRFEGQVLPAVLAVSRHVGQSVFDLGRHRDIACNFVPIDPLTRAPVPMPGVSHLLGTLRLLSAERHGSPSELRAELSIALALDDEPQDWGIANADGLRLDEFVAFLSSGDLAATQVFDLVELILASANQRLLEAPAADLRPTIDALAGHPAALEVHYDYWTSLDGDEFPLGDWLREFRLTAGSPTQLTGKAAQEFAASSLEKVRTNVVDWTIEYRDPRDGSFWLMDYPQSELHAGGPPRLRRVHDGVPEGNG